MTTPNPTNDTNYDAVFILAVHMACKDGQIHKQEVDALHELAKINNANSQTLDIMNAVLSHSSDAPSHDTIVKNIPATDHDKALFLLYYFALIDGHADKSELEFIDLIKTGWNISPATAERILIDAKEESDQNRLANSQKSEKQRVSKTAKIIRGVDTIFSPKLINILAKSVGSESVKEKIKEHRTHILLSGPEYDEAIAICKRIGEEDILVADGCLSKTEIALIELEENLNTAIHRLEQSSKKNKSDNASRSANEVIGYLKADKEILNSEISLQIKKIIDLQGKKRRAINFFTISFMGKSKAGKSTLHAIITGEGWDAIGVGKQNTTKFNRVYEWHNIRIIDTPGIAAPDGAEYQRIAESIIDESDLMCFVVTNNNQQKSEFEFLQHLKSKGKPLLVLMNVQENLTNETRLKRFLENPNDIFSDDKDRLGGHFDRIRRDAQEYYGTSDFPIIPVQLMAARLSRQENDPDKAAQLMKASRLQLFLNEVRLSLISNGTLRRSQNILGSTVVDIEQPLNWLLARMEHYKTLESSLIDRRKEAISSFKKAKTTQAKSLESGIRTCYESLREEIPDFADSYWDESESSLNSAWDNKYNKLVETKVRALLKKANKEFSDDVRGTLEEIGRSIELTQNIESSGFSLNEQDKSDLAHKASKFGGGILSTISGVLLILPEPVVTKSIAIAIGVIGAVAGFLSSLFETKASKKRKAVAKISEALEEQIDSNERYFIPKVMDDFNDQSTNIVKAVEDYFDFIIKGTSDIGDTLSVKSKVLIEERNKLNLHFASRLLDFSEGKTKDISNEIGTQRIEKVTRTVGKNIDITLIKGINNKFHTDKIDKILQEKITVITQEK